MKKVFATGLALIFVVSFAIVAIAEEEVYSLKGPVVSVNAGAKTVTVHSVEGAAAAADNRWKGDVTFETNDMTVITMGKEKKTLDDLKPGQELNVKFQEKNGKSIAVEIMINAGEQG